MLVLLTPPSVSPQPPVPHTKPPSTLEAGELEGDTLDPQTGLFYRSGPPSAHPPQPSSSSSSQATPASSSAPAPAPSHDFHPKYCFLFIAWRMFMKIP